MHHPTSTFPDNLLYCGEIYLLRSPRGDPGSPRGDKRLKLSDEEKAAVLRLHNEDYHCDFHFNALFSSQGFFESCGDMAAFDDSIPPPTTAAEPGQKRKRGQ